jgi:hypothetical protein
LPRPYISRSPALTGHAIQYVGAYALGQRHELRIQPALGRGRVFHADRHGREQPFEGARRAEVIARADLAHVVHHRLGRLGAVEREAAHQPLRHREEVVAHPRHRQVAHDVVAGAELVGLDAAAARRDEAGVRLAHALGPAGGARGVEDHADVGRFAARHRAVVVADIGLVEGPAQLAQLVVADQPRLVVVAQAFGVVIDDVADRGLLVLLDLAALEQLVDLLLVFDDHELDAASCSMKTISLATASW